MQIWAYLVILKKQFSNSYVSIPYGIHKWCDSTTVLPIRLIATTELTCKPCEQNKKVLWYVAYLKYVTFEAESSQHPHSYA